MFISIISSIHWIHSLCEFTLMGIEKDTEDKQVEAESISKCNQQLLLVLPSLDVHRLPTPWSCNEIQEITRM